MNDCSVQTNLCGKLVKADFTGAQVKVLKSANQSLINTQGIVVRETTRTFVIIQPDDQVKMLIKQGTVFQFSLPARDVSGKPIAINVWGDNILYKGSERTKIKFKEKYNLHLY